MEFVGHIQANNVEQYFADGRDLFQMSVRQAILAQIIAHCKGGSQFA